MVVNDLNPFWTSIAPLEADTPLIIDSNTVLSCSITAKKLESIARRDPEVPQTTRSVDLTQLAQRDASNARVKGRNRLPRRQPLGLAIPERLDHDNMIYRIASLTQTVNLHCLTPAFPPTRRPATAKPGHALARPGHGLVATDTPVTSYHHVSNLSDVSHYRDLRAFSTDCTHHLAQEWSRGAIQGDGQGTPVAVSVTILH